MSFDFSKDDKSIGCRSAKLMAVYEDWGKIMQKKLAKDAVAAKQCLISSASALVIVVHGKLEVSGVLL